MFALAPLRASAPLAHAGSTHASTRRSPRLTPPSRCRGRAPSCGGLGALIAGSRLFVVGRRRHAVQWRRRQVWLACGGDAEGLQASGGGVEVSQERGGIELGEPGDPLRGLSVHFLCTGFLADVRSAGASPASSVYDIEAPVLRRRGAEMRCPRDGRMGAAYVDAVLDENVGRATHMLSYSWMYSIGDIVDTLATYCAQQGLDPRRTYVWICCACVNQHRVKEAQAKGTAVAFETFREEFGARVRQIDHILAMMSPWHHPLYVDRVWCVFEFSTAIVERKMLTVLMPASEQEEFRKSVDAGRLQKVYSTLAALRIQDAKATVESDKVSILRMIDSEAANYDKSPAVEFLNRAVREKMKAWFVETAVGYVEEQLAQGNELDLEVHCAVSKLLIGSVSDYERARTLLKAGLDHERATSFARAEALQLLGITHKNQGHFEKARGYYQQSKAAFEEIGATDSPEYAGVLLSIGIYHMSQGDIASAQRCYEQAGQVYRSAGAAESAGYAGLSECIGISFDSQGRSTTAFSYYKQSKAIYERIGATANPCYAGLLLTLGSSYLKQGDTAKAILCYEVSRDHYEAAGATSSRGYAGVLMSMGNIFYRKGDLKVAQRYYEHAKAVYEAAGDTESPGYHALVNSILLDKKQLYQPTTKRFPELRV